MTSPTETGDAAPAAPKALFKKPRARPKGNIIKRPTTPEKKDSSSDDDSSSDENGLHRTKRRRKGTEVVASSSKEAQSFSEIVPTVHQADRSVPLKDSNDATKASNWHEGNNSAKIGPTKSSTNVRMTTFTEYTLGICKDFKKTGFCGFADSCIYVHDRGDWTQGWQLDTEWDKAVKDGKVPKATVVANANREQKTQNINDDDAAMLENIPFACIICEKSYREPIVTRCGHYFCEPCALTRYRKDPTCAACGAATNGVFNSASRLKKLLQRKKEREEKQKAEAEENDESTAAK